MKEENPPLSSSLSLFFFFSLFYQIYILYLFLFFFIQLSSFSLFFIYIIFYNIFYSKVELTSSSSFFSMIVFWCVWNLRLSPSSPTLGLFCRSQLCRVRVSFFSVFLHQKALRCIVDADPHVIKHCTSPLLLDHFLKRLAIKNTRRCILTLQHVRAFIEGERFFNYFFHDNPGYLPAVLCFMVTSSTVGTFSFSYW